MPFIKEMPEVKGKSQCDKHGEYEHRYEELHHCGSIMVSELCPKCAKELKEEEKRKEADEQRRLVKERIERTKEFCGIPRRYINSTFDSFECTTESQNTAKEKVQRWLSKFKEDIASCNSVMITGKVGTGKTLLASCILNDLIVDPWVAMHNRVRANEYEIIKLIDMVRSLKETWKRDSEKTERELIKHYSTLDLLIIDEVGMGFESDTEKLFIFDVIDGRYQNSLPTILISNLNAKGISDSIGERAVDRLRDGGGVLIGCDWESFRK